MKKLFISGLALGLLWACESKKDYKTEADTFLKSYSQQFQQLYTNSSEAEWASNTKIVEGDSTNAIATRKANEAFAAFTGSKENIAQIKQLLEHKNALTSLQIKQLETALRAAGNNPQTIPEVVKRRIKAETEQSEKLYGFDYKLNGKSVTTNQIDEILRTERDLNKRLQAWETSKEVGTVLKGGLVNLRNLRNETVKALGYNDYFSYQASDYGMQREDIMALMRKINQELKPLYRELHTYARYTLARKYGVAQVQDQLPAHWLPNRWGQAWSAITEVKGYDLNQVLNRKSTE